MKSADESFRRSALEILRAGPFRRYIIGSLISDTGTWMQVMAQAWVMSTLTNKAILLGLVNLFAGIPTLLLTMHGGAAADRYDKRKILVATQIWQIGLAILLGWLVLTHRIQIWHIIATATLLGVCIAFEMPAISAFVPELVRHEQIGAAVALDRSVFHGSRLIGPSLAGWLVSRFGAAAAFFGNATSFIALIIAIISIPPRKVGTKEEEEQRRSGMVDGFRYIKSDRIMILMIALIALTTIFVFPVISVMLPLYVRNLLHLGPDKLGLLMAVSGSGSLAGSLGFLTIAREHRFRLMTANAIAVASCAVLHVALEQFPDHGGVDGISCHRPFDEFRARQHNCARARASSRCAAASRPFSGSVFSVSCRLRVSVCQVCPILSECAPHLAWPRLFLELAPLSF